MGEHHRERRPLAHSVEYRARHGLGRLRPDLPAAPQLPWGLVLIGLGVVVGLLVTQFVVPARPPEATEAPQALGLTLPPSASPTPPAASQPGGGLPDGDIVRGFEALRHSPLPPPPSPTPTPEPTATPAPDPDVVGFYQVDEAYRDVFIGKVVIANHSAGARDWTVELSFSADVGKLNTFWVDGTPQPVLDGAGGHYVFTGAVPVPGRSWVVLKVHLDRHGHDIDPTLCTLNRVNCVTLP